VALVLKWYLWRSHNHLSSTSKIIIAFDVLVGAVIIIQFAQSNKWIPEQIPLPPFSILTLVAYLIILSIPIAANYVPQLDSLRQYTNGVFAFRWKSGTWKETILGFKTWFIKAPPKQLRLTRAKRLDFEKSVRELSNAQFPRTRMVLLGELRQKLALVCHEGNSWGKKIRVPIQKLLDIIEDNFDGENQSQYVDSLSVITGNHDPRTNKLVALRFADKISRLWSSSSSENSDLSLMTNVTNIILCLSNYDVKEVTSLMQRIVHDSNRVRFQAFLSSLRERGLLNLKRQKTLGTFADSLLTELSKSEENKEGEAIARVEELRKLVVMS